MRRITTWITAALAVAGLALAHWANIEGGGGKTGDGGPNPACTALADPATPANPECAQGGKPGERK